MASVRAKAERRHSTSKHGYVETFRTITEHDSNTSCDYSHEKGLEEQDRNFWLKQDSNKIAFLYRVSIRDEKDRS